MAGKRITTELRIKAVDEYSEKIRNMSGVTGRFAAKVRAEMGRLQDLRGPLRLIEDFKSAQSTFSQSEAAVRKSRQRLKELRAEINATENPTKKMTQEFDRAQRAAERMRRTHERNKTELSALQGKLRSAGINTGDLAGEQRRLSNDLDRASGAFARQTQRMERLKTMQDRLTAGRARMDRTLARSANLSFVGNAAMATGRRIISGLSAPIMQAVEFETAMSDVRKVVDFESPEAFKTMSEDILQLSTRIPIAATGLAEIVAAGGQSGVAQDELTRFAEMAAKIGVAFDISAGQSGESMARIKTAMDLDLDQTGSLFDAMNHLSNNSAARADQTLDFLNRAGADGANFGFDSTETLAIGAAMIAAGAGADTAGTSFRNMGRALTKGESATNRQSAAYTKLGLDAGAVARSMQEDAVGTTMDVLQRLNQLPDHLRASTMSDLFGDEARELTKLLNNMELMPEMLGMVADETQYLGSSEAEYAERSKTTANNMQLARNQMTRLGASIGEMVLPALNELLTKSQVFIDKMVIWTKEHPKLTKWLVIGGLALGAMAVAGGVLLTVAAGLIGTLAVLRFGLVGFGARAMFAGDGVAKLAGRFGMFNRLGRFGPALARFLGFRTSASAEISKLSSHMQTQSTAMSRSMSKVRWGSFFAAASTFSVMNNVPEDPEEIAAFQDRNVQTMDQTFRATPGLSHLMDAYENIFERVHGFAPPVEASLLPNDEGVRSAAQTVQGYAGETNLPTADYLDGMRGAASDLRAEISALEAEMEAIGAPESVYDVANPEYQQAKSQMEARIRDLELVEEQLAEDVASSQTLTTALRVLSDTSATPEISTESIDLALAKIQQLAVQFRSLPSSSSGESAGVEQPWDGARASGGPVAAGRPYLVNENTPRSEIFVPSTSGGILNVSQAQSVMRKSLQGGGRIRAAGLAALTSSALVGSAAAMPSGGAPVGQSSTTRVEIGSIQITAPSGVSDPEGLVNLLEARLGDRISATLAASFSD